MLVKNCGKKITVMNLSHASEIIRKSIDDLDMGSSKWYTYKENGYVFVGKEVIAHISYNGRMWDNDNKEIKAENYILTNFK